MKSVPGLSIMETKSDLKVKIKIFFQILFYIYPSVAAGIWLALLRLIR